MNYTNIQHHSWDQILGEGPGPWQRPLSVHIPIHPVHSPDLVHVDCALNAIRRRVHPKLSTREMTVANATKSWPTWMVQFALGNPPFVPDFRLSTVKLKDALPIVQAQYLAWDLLYDFEYSCRPIDSKENLLTIKIKVTNLSEKPLEAHVRPRVVILPESEIDDYHYVPFNWDAHKWIASDKVGFRDHHLLVGDQPIGRVVPGEFDCAWEVEADFTDQNFNARFDCGEPYWVPPAYRLNRVDHTAHLSSTLPPGASREFHIQLLTDIEAITADHVVALNAASPSAEATKSQAHFNAALPAAPTTLQFPTADWDEAFTAAQLSSLQLMLAMPGQTNLQPTQGGSSERHFVWVWEASYMLLPLLRLGHFAPVRKALDFIFSLQDGGYPPEGELTTTRGAVGTTGPRWLNSTGAAINLACEYLSFDPDPSAVDEYLPKILRALDWVIGEISATRKLNPDGSRPTWYGLMPFGCATDGDIGYIIALTDAYTLLGFAKAADYLEKIKHPRAAEIRAQVTQYCADLNIAIGALTRPDGYIERKIATGHPSEVIYLKFEYICNMSHMAFAARQGGVPVLAPSNPVWPKFQEYVERIIADGFFMGPMDREVMYIGVNEMMWHNLYLRAGEWKKAFASIRAGLHWGMSANTHQVVERFSKLNAAYTPWQPNGGGNGRALEMMINAIYFETNDAATLLGSIPFMWLTRNGTIRLDGLYTWRGRISVEAVVQSDKRIQITLLADRSGALPPNVILPDHFKVESHSKEAMPASSQFPGATFTLAPDTTQVSFIITENRI